MLKKFYNSDVTSKIMQNAGISRVLYELKKLKTFEASKVHPLLNSLNNIIHCYNCIPSKCLEKRINDIIKMYNVVSLEYNTKALIDELEAFLKMQKENTNLKIE